MTKTLKGAMNEKISNTLSGNEELLSLKQEIASLKIKQLEEQGKLNGLTSEILGNSIITYLSSDTTQDFGDAIKSGFMVNLVGKSLLGEETVADITTLKEKITRANTSELNTLKQEIMGGLITSPTVPETPPDISHENTPTNNIPTNTIPTSTPSPTPETFHLSDGEYTKYVEKILNVSTKHEGTPYLLGGISTKGFDCSGLWYYAFKEAGIQFPFRFTASVFDKHNKDVSKNSVIPGDFMYWRAKPGQKKHSDIYHIEMVVEKPYLERGKWYVKTFGSSTDKGVYVNGKKVNKSGVGYRVREITDHRHFDRPSYYEQLVQYEKTGDSKILMAA